MGDYGGQTSARIFGQELPSVAELLRPEVFGSGGKPGLARRQPGYDIGGTLTWNRSPSSGTLRLHFQRLPTAAPIAAPATTPIHVHTAIACMAAPMVTPTPIPTAIQTATF